MNNIHRIERIFTACAGFLQIVGLPLEDEVEGSVGMVNLASHTKATFVDVVLEHATFELHPFLVMTHMLFVVYNHISCLVIMGSSNLA